MAGKRMTDDNAIKLTALVPGNDGELHPTELIVYGEEARMIRAGNISGGYSTMPRPASELMRLAQFEPEALTEQDLARLSELMTELAETIRDMLTPALDTLVHAFTMLADALLPYVEYMPGPEFRRFRKIRQLREHRERVAARIPAWKRTY